MRKIYNILMMMAILIAAGCREKAPENSMQYRELGNTGIQVSEIGLGCSAFEECTPEEARAFIDMAIDSGINYVDLYDPNPKTRDNLGSALKGRHDKMMVQGHVGVYWNGQYVRTRNVDTARMGFEDMLTRLGTDHVEVGMMHIFDKMEDWDALDGRDKPYYEYVQQLKKEGKINHIGMSTHNAEVALAAAKSGKVEVIMFSINPLFDRVSSDKSIWDTNSYKEVLANIDSTRIAFYDYCAKNGIGVTVMKAFGGGGGRLLDKEKSPLGIGLTPSMCIAYCLAKPCIGSVLIGADNIEELEQDLGYLHATAEEKDYNSALTLSKAQKQDLGDCTYCNHCGPCPREINIPKINKLYDRALKEGLTAEIKAEYEALGHYAGDCIQCGACESRCPFAVQIRTRMKEAEKLFGK